MREWQSRLIFTALVALCAVPSESLAASSSAGTLASLSGVVTIRREAAPHLGAVDEPLLAGDIIATGEIASAKILLSDDSVIDLGPKSSFRVEAFQASPGGDRTATFTVLYGRFRALVTKSTAPGSKFEVKTRDAVMSVRGTEFIVNAPAGFGAQSKTELTVVRGSVAVSLPKINVPPVEVGASSQLVASSGLSALPQPVALAPEDTLLIERESRVADNTFVRTVSLDAGVRNDRAPTAATPILIAQTTVQAAATSVSNEKPLSVAPAAVLPGIVQPFTAHLSY